MKPEAGAFYFDKSDCTLWYCPTNSVYFDQIGLDKVNNPSGEDGTRFCSLEDFAKDFIKVAFLLEKEEEA